VDVFTHSAIASPMVTYRGPFVLRLPNEPLFNVNMMQKDLLMALEAGRENGVPLPTASMANEFLNAARAMGLADQDFAAVFTVLARMSGLTE
jgi:3-hydroxyisobutyrate dehydrogenase-like beta-hydroxyacid dehydrogenase